VGLPQLSEAPQPSEKPTNATTAAPRNSVTQSEAEIPPGTPGLVNPVGILGTRPMSGSKTATRMDVITTATSPPGTLGVNLLKAKIMRTEPTPIAGPGR
jgi:hypothetical protein